jgi:hypothetical protein
MIDRVKPGEYLRKSLLPSQKSSNVDVQRSTIGWRGLWTP